MGNQAVRCLNHLESVASTDGDDGETNLLQLFPVEDESTTRVVSVIHQRGLPRLTRRQRQVGDSCCRLFVSSRSR